MDTNNKPLPTPKANFSWTFLRSMEVGQHVEIPADVAYHSIASAIQYHQHATGWRFTRRGRSVWRLS